MRASLSLSCLAVVLLVACGGDDRRSMTISAATGGTVAASTHSVDIPAAALAADTAVTLSRADESAYPTLPGDRGVVLAVEPEGTVLASPASVTIHGDAVGAGADDAVSVMQLVDGVWAPREHTRDTETGSITTSISVFAPLGLSISEPGEGGSIVGTIAWGSGDPVEAAPIELHMGDTLVDSTTSDASGAYRFDGLEAGSYTIRVDYECMIEESVGLSAGEVTQDLVLCGG